MTTQTPTPLSDFKVTPDDVVYLVEHSVVLSPPPVVIEIERANGDILRILLRLDRPWTKSVWDKPPPSIEELLNKLDEAPVRIGVKSWYEESK